MSTILKSVSNLSKAIVNYSLVRPFVQFIPLKQKKFFCISMEGNNFGDNVRALSDYVAMNIADSEVVWAFTESYYERVNCSYKKVRFYSLRYYYEILTSKYILSNCIFNHKMLIKRRGQVYLQTWHGTTLKKLGVDVSPNENRSIQKTIERWLGLDATAYDMSLVDIFVSGSKYMSRIYKEKFLFKGELSEIGTPRNDIFFQQNPGVVNKVKKQYGIDTDTGIILYAPTFRTDSLFECYDIDLEKLRKEWECKTGRKFKILVRLHPNLLKDNSIFTKLIGDSVINASFYPDMQELLYSTDLLVTDYSSSMFDFMYTYRPVVIYAKDRNEYVRGMYFKLEELPFLLINNNDEIGEKIKTFDTQSYIQKIKGFMDKIGSVEMGNAREAAVSILLQK